MSSPPALDATTSRFITSDHRKSDVSMKEFL
jgi:hypothetical protein